MSKKPVRKILPKHIDMQTRLRSHWDQAKRQNPDKVKQTLAAEFFSIRQATVSGYLGGSIALNKEMVLQFVSYLGHCGYSVQPEDIDPELGDLLKYTPKVFVLSTVDRKAPSVEFITVDDPARKAVSMYGIQMDETHIAVVSPELPAHKNMKVCVTTNTNYCIGKLIDRSDNVVTIKPNDHTENISIKKVISIHKVVHIVAI